jgi:hypothetical protein
LRQPSVEIEIGIESEIEIEVPQATSKIEPLCRAISLSSDTDTDPPTLDSAATMYRLFSNH